MLKLYEYPREIEKLKEQIDAYAKEHDGDLSDFPLVEELDKLEMSKAYKALSIACIIKEHSVAAKAIKEEAKKLEMRAKYAENQAEHWKKYLKKNLEEGKEAYKDSRVEIKWRKSKRMQIGETIMLPSQCVTDPEPIISEVKAFMKKEGITEFHGFKEVEHQNIQIK